MSSAYHPQSNGLNTFLHCFVHSCPRRWSHWLSLAEFWYNTSKHSSSQRSPFEVLYGHSPQHIGLSPAVVSSVPDVESMLTKRTTMLALVHQHLLLAQQRMKHQADKRRSERLFAVGDSVYLKLQPYVQSFLAQPPPPARTRSFPSSTSGHLGFSTRSDQSHTSWSFPSLPPYTRCSICLS
jgi:hypothetical protein